MFGQTFTTDIMLISLLVLGIGILIILTRPLHQSFTSDRIEKIQGLHRVPVPRIGGVSIFIGIIIGLWFWNLGHGITGWLLLASAVPVFLFGVAEDLHFNISPAARLFAAIISGVLAVWLLHAWLPDIRVPVFDEIMKFAPVGICLTIFASTTMVHAYNLSDGLNGLCSGFALIALLGLQAIALAVGDAEIAGIASLVMFAVAGFWVLNFFTGKIFLGDGGAYLLGHLVSWLSILLSARHPEVSPWALFLNTLVPITDTILAIIRRLHYKQALGEPDRQHLHHLVFDFLRSRWLSRCTLWQQNSLAAGVILVLAATCSATAYHYSGFTNSSVGFCIVYVLMIVVVMRILKPYSSTRFEKSKVL